MPSDAAPTLARMFPETSVHDERLELLMDRADVNHAQRLSFRSDPELAIDLLEKALRKRGVRNPAAYALSSFRRAQEPSTDPARVDRFVRMFGYGVAHDREAFEEEIYRHLRVRPCPFADELRFRSLRVAHELGECVAPRECPVCLDELTRGDS